MWSQLSSQDRFFWSRHWQKGVHTGGCGGVVMVFCAHRCVWLKKDGRAVHMGVLVEGWSFCAHR